jgi:hypothetical protein
MKTGIRFYFIAISEWLLGRPWWYAKEIAWEATDYEPRSF